ncbi:hypothetical protein ONZ43_g4282 [Nemania bipapillata]|uniref:Uncharacterized protein n=1 Tax=Nemania bipapillata TaxID=110536 RepID=A0ACC2IPP4_9PEZI|nr:hypothetical protein ONZ43_g4282 [Nemania bipapillata]
MGVSSEPQEPWYLRSSVPVLFPTHDGFNLSMSRSSFDALVQDILRLGDTAQEDGIQDAIEYDMGDDTDKAKDAKSDTDDSLTLVSATTSQEIHGAPVQPDLITTADTRSEEPPTIEPVESEESQGQSHHPFTQYVLPYRQPEAMPEGDLENKMLTENADMAYRSTISPIVDLFSELEEVVSGVRLQELLGAAWEEDSLATLKIIFNARSIHLGKASRNTFYRCAGWLAEHHPLTLIVNLRWLSRPVIRKRADKRANVDETDPDLVIVNMKSEKDVDDMTRFDVKYGVSHGYWKDLLNILVLAVKECLHVLQHPDDILYVERPKMPSHKRQAGSQHARRGRRNITHEEAKTRRHNTRGHRHKQAVEAFNSNSLYRGLYLTVARLFAEQLKTDLALLKSEDSKAKKNISLCAKWAPSHDRFHDKHTFIVSSIAEMLHPRAEMGDAACGEDTDREGYLRLARESYRKDVSALRAHLDIVERKLSAKAYDEIAYDRVPSLAMKNYAEIFAAKDGKRFEEYLDGVAEGKTNISGATLLPSTLIRPWRMRGVGFGIGMRPRSMADRIVGKVADAQWNTLVQRIKDSGTLESSIAICDVSGSMQSPIFKDGTSPIDSSIGLSLLLAEVTAPPFGGQFITFSLTPEMEKIDLSRPLSEKIGQLSRSFWGMNTNLVAVFESLILPMAIENKVSQEDMVKRVFVFSDMHFDAADDSSDRFGSSFDRIKRRYADAGYEMPQIVFWNLAGGRAGYDAETSGDPTAPKPITCEDTGTAIVNGYSQAMLKMFLDNGSFEVDGEDDEENIKTTEDADDDDAVVVDFEAPAKKRRLDPMSAVKKAIGHKAYDPLVVMD